MPSDSSSTPSPALPVALWAGTLVLVLVAFFSWPAERFAAVQVEGESPAQSAAIELESIGALEFGPEGVLFVSDPQGAAVYALEVPAGPGPRLSESVPDLDAKIGSLLGVDGREIYVQDMAVDPRGGLVYISVQRGDGDTALPVLLTVDSQGTIRTVDLATFVAQRLDLPNAPRAEDRLYEWEAQTFTVTDLEYVDGELLIAGLSNEEFASVLRRAPYPFDDTVVTTGLEIFHGAHGEWETFAPIFSFVPYTLDGKEHLLAAYLCTPLVTFPLDEVRSKSRLRGKTIAELGWGNLATDILPYRYDDEDYVLIVNNTRGTIKMKAKDIAAAAAGQGLTEQADTRAGVDYHTVPVGPVLQLSDLDSERVLLLGRSLDNGSLYLSPRPKRRL